MSLPLLVVDDPLFDNHRPPGPHFECPERLTAARLALNSPSIIARIKELQARDATLDELSRVHTERYIEQLGHSAGREGFFDADTYFGPGSVAAAMRAAGAAVVLGDALSDTWSQGSGGYGIALVRPPGHHALSDRAMGFCLLNNVAVAARAALAKGIRRILVLDFDVHHGNGTQDIFYADPSVLYVSLHEYDPHGFPPFYPETGGLTEVGTGDGRGYTINVPLGAGADDAVYLAAFERIVAPIAEQYAPELVLVSAGFDAHASDPLAEMLMTEAGYAAIMERLIRAVGKNVPIGLVLEGGYDFDALTASLRASAESLLGISAPPILGSLDPTHALELERIQKYHQSYWKLG